MPSALAVVKLMTKSNFWLCKNWSEGPIDKHSSEWRLRGDSRMSAFDFDLSEKDHSIGFRTSGIFTHPGHQRLSSGLRVLALKADLSDPTASGPLRARNSHLSKETRLTATIVSAKSTTLRKS
jgi:hypothetical protein